MASEVCAALGLAGDDDLSGKLVAVAEERGGDAGFLTASLMCHALADGAAICLLALREGAAHHRRVAKKLGHDLQAAEDAGRAVVLHPFDTYARPSGNFAAIDMSVEDNLKRVFLDVKSALDSFSGKKCLVIDDLSDLLTLGASVPLVLFFLQYCRTLRLDDGVAMVVCSRLGDEDDDERRVLANLLAHSALKRATVAGLKTGFSNSLTGSVQVEELGPKSVLATSRLFHYKATDRQVKVFAPGTVGITY